jgi:hypothetical protein
VVAGDPDGAVEHAVLRHLATQLPYKQGRHLESH